MATLRVAFLSGGVLEFLTTLSVALVAVEVGMRLVFGNISLFHGLAVIMLAPEVFEPLRQVGAQFHASANGVTASRAAFDIIEEAQSADSPGATTWFFSGLFINRGRGPSQIPLTHLASTAPKKGSTASTRGR